MIVIGSLLAWRNLRLGRGDKQGAFRIAALAFVLSMGLWIFGAHHVGWPGESNLFLMGVGTSLVMGSQLWIAYIALEPFVRRHWPKTIIAWTRTLTGGLRDPLVGRDILIGMVVGVGYDLVIAAAIGLDMRRGDAPGTSALLFTLVSFPHLASGYMQHLLEALVAGLLMFMIFFLLRVVLRRELFAGIAFVAILSARGLASDSPVVETCMYVAIYAILVTLLLRFGLLAVMVCIFVTDLLVALVFTPDFGAWYGTGSLLTLLSIAALALFAFRTSTAGKPLFAGFLDK